MKLQKIIAILKRKALYRFKLLEMKYVSKECMKLLKNDRVVPTMVMYSDLKSFVESNNIRKDQTPGFVKIKDGNKNGIYYLYNMTDTTAYYYNRERGNIASIGKLEEDGLLRLRGKIAKLLAC